MPVTLRPAAPLDRVFVEKVYFETQRWIIERLFGWRGDEIERKKFEQLYSEGATRIISLDGNDVGWISTTSDAGCVEIGQIYLLLSGQRRGIGSQIIRDVINSARAQGLPVRLSTAKINPAIKLYERLGFRQVGESEFKIFMELR